MKKRLVALLILALVTVLALASCGDPIGDWLNQFLDTPPVEEIKEEYAVYFLAGEGIGIPSQTVEEGSLVTKPEDPYKEGFLFDGWYKDAEFTEAWNFDTDTVTKNTIIYGKWVDHTHSGGTATCTEKAICEVCDHAYGSLLDHVGGTATCTAQAECEVCGTPYGQPLGHDVVVIEGKAPTCTETGLTDGAYCTRCDAKVEQEVIDALGHTPVVDEAVAPTCTETGLTEGSHCSTCETVLEAQEVIPATGHTWGEWIVDVEPTENVEGSKHRECACGERETVAIPALNHTHSYTPEVTTAPTCTEAGVKTFTCECGDTYTEAIPATGHTEGEVVVENEVAATCTAEGSHDNVVYCVECDAELSRETVTTDALGHKDENGDFKCDTCSTVILPEADSALTVAEAMAIAKALGAGKYTSAKYYITGTIVDVYNTQYGNLYIKDSSTSDKYTIYGLYSADGKTRYDAMTYKPVAGDEITVYGVIGSYNTSAQMKDGWLDDVVAHEHDWAEATCKDPARCTICGTTTGDVTDHVYVDGVCKHCGLEEGAVITEVVFEFGANGSATHVDGNDLGKSKSYTVSGYTLNLTGMEKVYGPAYDAKGNSCIKLGTSSVIAKLSFTVPDDVVSVVINIAKYKANTSKITVNGTSYTLTKNSNDGQYDAITVDTSVNKTVSIVTVSGGARAMINSIVFVLGTTETECQHEGGTATCQQKAVCDLCGEEYGEFGDHDYDAVVTAPTCTEGGYTTYTCSCGDTYTANSTPALGHKSENGYHNCDTCGETLTSCIDETPRDHECDLCGLSISECVDANKNHKCDICNDVMSKCADDDHNHFCDWCGVQNSHCINIDPTKDHKCDWCGATVDECVDVDPRDHECDVCGAFTSECVDANKNHKCDICNDVMSKCADDDHNHFCDWCGVQNSHCININPTEDHTCDWCGATMSECADDDRDHECDICFKSLSDCADKNNDHKCDICKATLSKCKDDDHNHNCDICGVQNSHCININPTEDHTCDWCGATMSECADNDRDHECDICFKSTSDCADNNNNHKCDLCNATLSKCADTDKNHFCDLCGVQNSHCMDLPPYDHNCDWCSEKMSECADNNSDHKCDVCGTTLSQCAGETVVENRTESTCSVAGSYDNVVYCSTCEKELSRETITLSLKEHTWGDWYVSYIAFFTDSTEQRDCSACGHYETRDAKAVSQHTITFGSNGNYGKADVEGVVVEGLQVVNNGGNNAQVKNGTIYITVKAGAIVTINGYPNYTDYNFTADGNTVNVKDALNVYEATSETTLTITVGDVNNYFYSISINYPNVISEDTEITFGSNGNYKTVQGLAISDMSGIRDNGGDNTQFSKGTMTFSVKAGAVVTISSYENYTSYTLTAGTFTSEVITDTSYSYCVAEDSEIVLTPASGNNYFYSISIVYPTYVKENTVVSFGSEGNYKTTVNGVYLNAAIRDNGGNNSQISSGSITLYVKAGATVIINGYHGYTSYCINGGAEITDKYYSYTATENTELVITPVNGNNYFYSIVVEYSHEYNSVVTDPDCVNGGYTTHTCAVCGHTYKDSEVDALGHTPVVDEAVAPTCTKTGLTEGSHCDACGETLTAQETVNALGHTPVVDKAVAPTCTKTGLTEGSHCDACGETLTAQETVDALGHTPVIDKAVAPTCTDTGLTEGSHCDACGETLTAQEVVPATGHDEEKAYEVIDGVLYLSATCGCASEKVAVDTTVSVPVSNEADLKTVLTSGYSVVLESDIALTSNIHLTEAMTVVINLNGKTIDAAWDDANNVVDVLWAKGEGVVVTITGNGTMTCTGDSYSTCVVSATDGAKVVIEDGKFTSNGSACIYATRGGVVEILGGEFSADEEYLGNRYLLDVNEAEELGTITVKGGIFHNFDPANHTNDRDYTNKVADGYHSIGNDGVYTVSAHDYEYSIIQTAPTCTEDGYTTYTCICGDSYVDDIYETPGHSYNAVVTDPTCEDKGYTTHTCSVCGDSYVDTYVDANGHKHNAVVTDPTCTTAGYTTYTCACGDNYTADEVVATGHTEVTVSGEDATCTEDGLTEGKKCSVCGEVTVAQDKIDATGHDEYDLEEKAATCEEDGSEGGTGCSTCGNIIVAPSIVAALGHKHTTNTKICDNCGKEKVEEWVLVTDASQLVAGGKVVIVAKGYNYALSTAQNSNNRGQAAVTKNGNNVTFGSDVQILTLEAGTASGTWALQTGAGYLYAASNSSNHLKTQTTNNANGIWNITVTSAGVATIKATGSNARNWMRYNLNNGSPIFSCYASGQEDIVIYIKSAGYVEHVHTEKTLTSKAETCTENGLTEGKQCTVCGEVTVAQTEIPATGHNYVIDKAVAPTCQDTGLTEGTHCENGCDIGTVKQDVVPVIDCIYVDGVCTMCGVAESHVCSAAEAVKENNVDPTCTANGSYDMVVYCEGCGDKLSAEHFEVEATGHNYEDDVCTKCGERDPSAKVVKEITFNLGANGSASHSDGSSATTYTETVDGYNLSITNGTKMYKGARDAKGNSCLKFGTTSATGSMKFTVPDNVTKVVIYVAQYKANATKVTINGTTSTITTASTNGAYTPIEIDTTTTKTVNFATATGGVRAMINTIVFFAEE